MRLIKADLGWLSRSEEEFGIRWMVAFRNTAWLGIANWGMVSPVDISFKIVQAVDVYSAVRCSRWPHYITIRIRPRDPGNIDTWRLSLMNSLSNLIFAPRH